MGGASRGMSATTSLFDELRAAVGPDCFLAGEALEAYRIGGTRPQAALLPVDEETVSRILALAWEADLGVVPWGGGCHQSIGYSPSRYDLALDVTRMDRVLAHEPADMTATAQAGIRMADLQRRMGEHGQFLPLDVSMPERVTLGGVLASKLSGPLRCRYGTARDLILGMRVAHADGTITKGGAKVVKNATGYDVTKLYLGSHGTLGVILEATFRLYPAPDVEQAWWLPVHDLTTAQALANRILSSHLVPNRVELLEEVAGRTCGVSGSGLLVSISGLSETVQAEGSDLERMAGELGAPMVEVRDAGAAWRRPSDFPWRNPAWDGRGVQALWRGGVPPVECAKACQACHEATPRGVETAVAASISHGALRGAFRADTPEALVQRLGAARDALSNLGGYLVIMALPEAVRDGIDPWGGTLEGLGVMARLKAAFDAKGILNPGRFVGRL